MIRKTARSEHGALPLAPCCLVYDPNGEHALLSNFAHTPFEVDGAGWPTVEHYFQAAKFSDGKVKSEVQAARSGAEAKALAWSDSYACSVREDWDTVRVQTMHRALSLKFDQNVAARAALALTWPQPILEDSPTDAFWGIGPDGNGSNVLGMLLEEVRAAIVGRPLLYSVALESRPPGQGGMSRTELLRADWIGGWTDPAAFEPLMYAGFMELDIFRTLDRIGSPTAIREISLHHQHHAELLDAKYADYSWTEDARSATPNWLALLVGAMAARCSMGLTNASIIAVGAGSANESANVWRAFGSRMTLVDWGTRLSQNCAIEAPEARVVRARAEDLAVVPDGSQDIYCSLRTYDSALIDVYRATREAYRVLRPQGLLVISISDGYLTTGGSVIRGQMGPTGRIERATSWSKLLDLLGCAEQVGFREFSFFDLGTEIGFIARALFAPPSLAVAADS